MHLEPDDRLVRGRLGHGHADSSSTRATRNITASPSAGASTCTPIGSPAVAGAERHADRRVAGEVGGDRAHVGEVHRQRVGRLGAELERDRGRRGRQQHVELLVRAREVADDERAHPLRLAVVRVVVAGRQRVRAEHDAALHLGTEAGVARARVHRGDVVAVDAQAVAHAVVASEVRRRLGRRDQVVRRQPVARAGHAHPLDGRARLLQRARPRGRPRRAPRAGCLRRRSARRRSRCAARRRRGRRTGSTRLVGRRDRRGVHRVVAGDHVEQQRGVAHAWWRTGRSGRASWRTR